MLWAVEPNIVKGIHISFVGTSGGEVGVKKVESEEACPLENSKTTSSRS